MKPAISYGLVRAVYRNGWQIMAITSVVGKRVYGRDQDGNPTNRATRDLLAQFPRWLDCRVAIEQMEAVDAHHAPLIKEAERAVRAAVTARDEARVAACRGRAVDAPEPPFVASVA